MAERWKDPKGWPVTTLAGAALLLAGCAPQDPYVTPAFPFLGGYQSAAHTSPVLLGNDDWWQRLGDPVLNRLVAAGLGGNLSLDIARARVAGATAAFAATPGLISLSSTVSATGSGALDQDPTGGGSAQTTLTWLLDPYGAQKARTGAARASIEVAEAELSAARLLVLNNLGNAYVDLRYRQSLVALRDQEMRGRRQTLAMTRTLLDAQDATRLEAARSEARVAEIEAQMPGLRAAVAAKKNEIAVLVGVAPGTLSIDLDKHASQPRPNLAPNVGIPADLMRNRPDIQIAERQYYIALAGLTEAEAAQYPRLSLSGALSLTLGEAGRSAAGYVFGPTLALPALPTGQARAGVARARAAIDAAHANWKSTVLTALLEVENALLDYGATSASQRSTDKAARLYAEALDLTRKLFAGGDATLSDLIAAEQDLANARQAQAETLYQRSLAFVALNVRLGAGHGVVAGPP